VLVHLGNNLDEFWGFHHGPHVGAGSPKAMIIQGTGIQPPKKKLFPDHLPSIFHDALVAVGSHWTE
jgi:hypothetical protein